MFLINDHLRVDHKYIPLKNLEYNHTQSTPGIHRRDGSIDILLYTVQRKLTLYGETMTIWEISIQFNFQIKMIPKVLVSYIFTSNHLRIEHLNWIGHMRSNCYSVAGKYKDAHILFIRTTSGADYKNVLEKLRIHSYRMYFSKNRLRADRLVGYYICGNSLFMLVQ